MTTEVIKEYYQNESVARNYDRERFGGFFGRLFDRFEKWAVRRVMMQVVKEIPAPTVLDVPCGTGRITKVLLAMGLEVTGGDISREMIEVARARCARFGPRISFQRIDLDAPNLPENSFDVVTCIRMLHHLDSKARRSIYNALSKMSQNYVLVNVSYSSPFYRLRRRVKKRLGQGISRESSTWRQIQEEAHGAGLTVAAHRFVCRYGSEDLVVLFRKG